jgi:hypothetical protein
VGYSRLVLHSFAFQQAYVRGVQQSDQPMLMRVSVHLNTNLTLSLTACAQCLEAATAVLDTFIERLAPSGYMRYSPDGEDCFYLEKLLAERHL